MKTLVFGKVLHVYMSAGYVITETTPLHARVRLRITTLPKSRKASPFNLWSGGGASAGYVFSDL